MKIKKGLEVEYQKALSLAIWLIDEKGKSLKYAIRVASNKHGYFIKSHIEEGVRNALGEDYFINRLYDNTSLNTDDRLSYGLLEKNAQQHLNDILI